MSIYTIELKIFKKYLPYSYKLFWWLSSYTVQKKQKKVKLRRAFIDILVLKVSVHDDGFHFVSSPFTLPVETCWKILYVWFGTTSVFLSLFTTKIIKRFIEGSQIRTQSMYVLSGVEEGPVSWNFFEKVFIFAQFSRLELVNPHSQFTLTSYLRNSGFGYLPLYQSILSG